MTPGFATAFRAEAFSTLEYSLGETPHVLGALVGGEDASFAARALAFARGTSFGAEWARAAGEVIRRVSSTAYLFRVDGRGDVPLALSLYANFSAPVGPFELGEVLQAAAPLAWDGPSPHLLARILGLAAPSGIGLRVDAQRRMHVAFYFQVPHFPFAETIPHTLPRLVQACGYGADVAAEFARVMPPLYGNGPLGVVGVDGGGSGGAVGALKFDPAFVPVGRALRFLRERGVAPSRLREGEELARTLQAPFASYLGVKFRPEGFAGWRLYFTTTPARRPLAGTAALDVARGRSAFFLKP